MEEVKFENMRNLMITHANKILEISLDLRSKVVGKDIDNAMSTLGEMIATCRSLMSLYEDEKVVRVSTQLRNETTKEEFLML